MTVGHVAPLPEKHSKTGCRNPRFVYCSAFSRLHANMKEAHVGSMQSVPFECQKSPCRTSGPPPEKSRLPMKVKMPTKPAKTDFSGPRACFQWRQRTSAMKLFGTVWNGEGRHILAMKRGACRGNQNAQRSPSRGTGGRRGALRGTALQTAARRYGHHARHARLPAKNGSLRRSDRDRPAGIRANAAEIGGGTHSPR